MAITEFQRQICQLIARRRVEQGERYVAGAVALNTLIGAPRVSRDVDLFHDTREALQASWDADRELLRSRGYEVEVRRERSAFVEALVRRDAQRVLLEWVCDSAFRFFPLVEHEDFGLVLHPFDLATNKVLALVGRLEVRDWVDIIECSARLQPLGYLAWAACGKDPGYSPAMILADARRSSHYSAAEVAELAFDGPAPTAAELSRRWAAQLREAEAVVDALPAEHVGACVLDHEGKLFVGSSDEVSRAVAAGAVIFHHGSIGGALPTIVG